MYISVTARKFVFRNFRKQIQTLQWPVDAKKNNYCIAGGFSPF